MRWILPYIAPFLCSLLWFCCKPFAAHRAKPPNVGLSSCLPALALQGESLHLPQPYAKWRLSRSQGVRNAPKCSYLKKQWLKPTAEGIPELTLRCRALLLSVQCIFATCSISLTYFSSALLKWEASLTWMGAARDTLPLYMLLAAEKEKLLKWKPPCLHFATTHSHNLQPGKQLLRMGHWFISCHAPVRQPWTEVEACKMASAIRGP